MCFKIITCCGFVHVDFLISLVHRSWATSWNVLIYVHLCRDVCPWWDSSPFFRNTDMHTPPPTPTHTHEILFTFDFWGFCMYASSLNYYESKCNQIAFIPTPIYQLQNIAHYILECSFTMHYVGCLKSSCPRPYMATISARSFFLKLVHLS
jgi:hypothetical protein